MKYCDMCHSAGSVNAYGLCEVCGNEQETEDIVSVAAEPAGVV